MIDALECENINLTSPTFGKILEPMSGSLEDGLDTKV